MQPRAAALFDRLGPPALWLQPNSVRRSYDRGSNGAALWRSDEPAWVALTSYSGPFQAGYDRPNWGGSLKEAVVKQPRMYRQGDVLVVAVDAIPGSAKIVDRDRGLVVLAYGEVTGHAHAIADPRAELLEVEGDQYLRVAEGDGVSLSHEEHDTIVLPPGEYQVVRQREYKPEAPRRVAD
jgi:hypothetical protein